MIAKNFVALCLTLMLCGSLHASDARAGDASETRSETLSLLIGEVRVGSLQAKTRGNEVTIDYEYRNNGRGPTLKEHITLDESGLPSAWTIQGHTTFGSKVDESFAVQGSKARWSDSTGTGESDAARKLYAAQSSSPWALGLYARALLADGESSMAAYPAGNIALQSGEEITLTGSGDSLTARVYSLGGLDLNPSHILLDGDRQLAAFITPRFVAVRAGYEAESTRLRALAAELSTRRLESLAQQTAFRFEQPVRISPVRIFDPHTLRLSEPRAVVVHRNMISSVQLVDTPASPDEIAIDGGGGTLIAGMFEMHGHLSQEQAALNIAAGVTSVRDMGNANEVLDGLIRRIEQGQVVGPRVVRSGFIEGKSPFNSNNGILVDSQQAALEAVRWYAARGFWQVKLYNSMDPAWAEAVVAEAHALGLRVAGHVPAFGTANGMLDAGFDEMTHINQVMLGWVLEPGEDTRTLLRFTAMKRFPTIDLDGPAVRATFDRFTRRGVAMEPTLAIHERGLLQRDGAEPVGGAGWVEHMPIGTQRDMRQSWFEIATPEDDAGYRAAYAKIVDTLRAMHRSGILLVPGTDLGGSFAYHRELELFQTLGMSAAEVLRRATLDMAVHLGRDQSLGSIEAHKLADFFLVDGDPTADLSALKRIRLVAADGVFYRPSDIHAQFGITPFVEGVALPGASR